MSEDKLPSFITSLTNSMRLLGQGITELLESSRYAEKELAAAINQRRSQTSLDLFADLLGDTVPPEDEAGLLVLEEERKKVQLIRGRVENIYAAAKGETTTITAPKPPVPPPPPAPVKVNGNGESKLRDLLEAARLNFPTVSIADVKDAIRQFAKVVGAEDNWDLPTLLNKTGERLRIWRGILRSLRIDPNSDEQPDWDGLVAESEKQVRRSTDSDPLDLYAILERSASQVAQTRDALDSLKRTILHVVTLGNVDGLNNEEAARRRLPTVAKELGVEGVTEDADTRMLGVLARKRLAQLQKAANAKPAVETQVAIPAELAEVLSFGQKKFLTPEEAIAEAKKLVDFVNEFQGSKL